MTIAGEVLWWQLNSNSFLFFLKQNPTSAQKINSNWFCETGSHWKFSLVGIKNYNYFPTWLQFRVMRSQRSSRKVSSQGEREREREKGFVFQVTSSKNLFWIPNRTHGFLSTAIYDPCAPTTQKQEARFSISDMYTLLRSYVSNAWSYCNHFVNKREYKPGKVNMPLSCFKL